LATKQQQHTPAGKIRLHNLLLIFGLSILLCGEAYFGYRVQSLSAKQEQIKKDYSTVNSITFGLFSVDQWRDKIVAIVNGKVRDFSMTAEQKKALQAQIEQQLHALINKAVAGINKPQKSIGGKLKKFAFNSIVNTDQINAQVPSFARTIMNKVNSPSSKDRLKDIVTTKIEQLKKQTFDSTATARIAVDSLLFRKYQVSTKGELNKHINTQLVAIRQITYNYAYAMVGCVVLALGLWWLMRKKVRLHTTLFIFSLMFALIMLIVGITASIIEVDASVKTVNFILMGQTLSFDNQELFFQSKSILQIVVTLIRQSKPDAVLVGLLILVFIIVLPVVRMLARGIHILSPKKIAESKAVTYLAFEAGKWDMADVMVVGILMTYIGLNGILKNQLSDLNIHNSLLTTITENNTSLQPGYFIFVGYVVLSLILSAILKRITPHSST
jgi:hypothetical protein